MTTLRLLGSRLTVEATDTPGMVLVAGDPVTSEVRARLTLDSDETAVERYRDARSNR